jgi:hypothetical protein
MAHSVTQLGARHPAKMFTFDRGATQAADAGCEVQTPVSTKKCLDGANPGLVSSSRASNQARMRAVQATHSPKCHQPTGPYIVSMGGWQAPSCMQNGAHIGACPPGDTRSVLRAGQAAARRAVA